jgi:hypothetical protein
VSWRQSIRARSSTRGDLPQMEHLLPIRVCSEIAKGTIQQWVAFYFSSFRKNENFALKKPYVE